MARYKKRPTYDELMPGLFDDLENNLFPDEEPYPTLPDIKKEALRKPIAGGEKLQQDLFSDEEIFTPLQSIPHVDRLKFISFGSGSSGNCTYIGDDHTGLLIDAGVDFDRVVKELQRNGIDMKNIKGIVLTHDHSDHVRFVYQFARKYRHILIYCTPRTLNGLLRRHSISRRIKDYHKPIFKEHPFQVGNFTITAFEVSHDGTDNAGFFIQHGNHALTVSTDLGCITDRADHYMRQANYLMIEANYDADMLAEGRYPEYLKARIRSGIGHLDNLVTAKYLAQIYTPALRNIFLCHLSEDNNKPEIALAAVTNALKEAGVECIGDCSESPAAKAAPVQLMALPRYESTGQIILRLL